MGMFVFMFYLTSIKAVKAFIDVIDVCNSVRTVTS